MNFQITTQKVPLTRSFHSFVRDHVTAALAGFARRIESVQVELRDKNGRRGGGDKRVRIRVLVPGRLPVTVEEMRASVREAVRHATGRAAAEVRATLRATPAV